MNRSFKLKIFLELAFLTMLVILANRQISQFFLLKQTEGIILGQMFNDLKQCAAHVHDSHQFIHCAEAGAADEILNSNKAHYVTCPFDRLGEYAAVCENFSADDMTWELSSSSVASHFFVSRAKIDGDEWLAVKRSASVSEDVVLLKASWIGKFVEQMWRFRDQNILKAVPIILFMMVGLSLYLVYSALKPVKLIADKMSQLNSQNLSLVETITSPYQEFDRIAEQYDNLRKRLAHSFEKARRFSADVSHELRTPLSILRGATERLIGQLPAGSDAQIQVRLMGDEIERLVQITEKLLLLSHADADILKLDVQKVNLSDVLNQFVEDARTFHPNLTIRQRIQNGVVWACDPQLMYQLLQNLYTNAVKYNKPSGWIDIQLQASDEQIQLAIENTTTEVPPDLEVLAFERFFRGDASRTRAIDGLGLGLSICQEIAHAHRGALTLRVTSQNTVCLNFTASLQIKMA